ncbi:phytanoyl-CoA dioxygenase family protein [Streptomyces sp. NPDC051940]|uniref:phytanoyl-CoA dioxygenase family protein n=1 Tax=Streptomyces sp. NPDC051940 TaxID=3155675 RepID=UPI00341915F9
MLDQWKTEGFVAVDRPLFAPDQFGMLRDLFEEHLATRGDSIFHELDMPHTRDARLLELLLDDAVLDLVEPITGPDIVLWSSGFICKVAHTGPPTLWHSDAAYWKGRLDNEEGIVTVWLAIDPSTRDNGCMRVIPGTHLAGHPAYRVVDQEAFFHSEATDVDESAAVDLELAPGHCSLHDGRILHGARANTSPHRRAGYTMRYLPATTRIRPEAPGNQGHQVWLARGRATAPNRYVNA